MYISELIKTSKISLVNMNPRETSVVNSEFLAIWETFTKESTILVRNIFIRTRFVHLKTELNSYKLTSLHSTMSQTDFIRVPAKMAQQVTAGFRLFVLVLGVLLGRNQ